jgi:hypothetical protein
LFISPARSSLGAASASAQSDRKAAPVEGFHKTSKAVAVSSIPLSPTFSKTGHEKKEKKGKKGKIF